MRYYLVAGEASGDLHASNLMKALKQEDHEAQFRYYGGDLMSSVGGTLVRHYRELAYMGFIPVLTHLPTILGNMSHCKADIWEWNPDVVILIDYPGFNLSIAKYVSRHTQIPVFYYISPKLWAWKEYRIKDIRRYVTALYSILPFEVEYFKRHQYKVDYVGNPCVDAISEFLQSEHGNEPMSHFISSNNLSEKPIIALLAGSRRQEIKDNLRIMLRATADIKTHQTVIAGAPGISREYYESLLPANCNATVVYGQTYRLLRQSEAALVTSGTATLETALMRVPQVVCYYVAGGKITSLLRRLLLKVKYISLVNLILGREAVTELVADGMTAKNVHTHLLSIMKGGKERARMMADYDHLAQLLGKSGASERAARLMTDRLKDLKPKQ